MELLSREYGWTPEYIREMDYTDFLNYLTIIDIRNQLEKNQSKKYGRK